MNRVQKENGAMTSNQRFVLYLAGMLLMGVAVMKVSVAQQQVSPPANVLRTERIEIVGKDGKIRAVLGEIADKDRHSFSVGGNLSAGLAGLQEPEFGLVLYDKNENQRAEILLGNEAYSSEPYITLKGESDKSARAELNTNNDGSYLRLTGNDAQGNASLGVHTDGTDLLLSHQLDETRRTPKSQEPEYGPAPPPPATTARFTVGFDGSEVSLTPKKGKEQVKMKLLPNGAPSIEVTGADAKKKKVITP